MTDPAKRDRPPRVTVCVPARNAGGYLAHALESVLRQTCDDWEAVVADDASSDDTFAIASSFAERDPGRIKAVRLDENSGPAVARNTAVGASSGGELIALLDADDHWLPTYLERQVALFDRETGAGRRIGIVACNAQLEGPDGIEDETFGDRFGWVDPIDYDSMIERSYIFVGSVFTRAAYDEAGGFSPECWGSEDYDLWLRILEAGYEVAVTGEPLAVYRLHAGGLSTDQLTMADAGIVAYRRALERAAASPRQLRAIRARLRHYRALRERALVRRALHERQPLRAAALALRAVPYGVQAVAQDPSRWGEWATDLFRRGRKPRGPGPLVNARS